jgi:hypothetical protein
VTFKHESFFKEKNNLNVQEFTNMVLPELTFLEGTPTLPTSNSIDGELTSGGEGETEPTEEA